MPRNQQGQGVPLWRALVTGPTTRLSSRSPRPSRLQPSAQGPTMQRSRPREVPAKSIPVPTDVSPGMQKFIAAPLNPVWHDLWKTGEEWRKADFSATKKRLKLLPIVLFQRLRKMFLHNSFSHKRLEQNET